MASPLNNLQESVLSWLSGWLTKQGIATPFQVTPLAGDGSPRPFYRVRTSNQSFVLLHEPAWTLSKDYAPHQAYLISHGISVPAFLCEDNRQGYLLMQDLGDELLQNRILSHPEQRQPWLTKAITLLADLHGKTYPVPGGLPASTRRFDEAKYFEELIFTFEHLHQGLLKIPAPGKAIIGSVKAFCKDLEKITPLVFSHRDYHTRNLIVHQERLWLIDFQDARLGPPHYDLASILYDSYVPINEPDRHSLLEDYQRGLKAYLLFSEVRWDSLETELRKVALQRTLKAAGSFASFFTRYGKTTHLPYLLPALNLAKDLQTTLGVSAPPFPLDDWIELSKEFKT